MNAPAFLQSEAYLRQRLDYAFRNHDLLRLALTHPSVQGEANYQRLEFLGDAAIELYAADHLYRLFPEDDEGALAKKKSALVSRESLAEAAEMFELGRLLRMSPGEERIGGRSNPKNLEDAAEALAGALYADGGHEAAARFLNPTLHAKLTAMTLAPQDPKTALQEFLQGRRLPLPSYTAERIGGESHAPVFLVRVEACGKQAEAEAASKKAGERAAAEGLLRLLLASPTK